ncbi:hypothetical protein [Mycoplasmopsis columbinasalis]|uniref:Lipoprotein n=1 Tax=Mycoplasmopsis columbinasalis TaxID=114880 RepID=A0A449B9V6_9BACT|nr:hypothetical protein [Mycoplasmopsis columbinasalis]VEU77947.1 Uncharacterised protein [Mycoplasmopsis columbinasalis]
MKLKRKFSLIFATSSILALSPVLAISCGSSSTDDEKDSGAKAASISGQAESKADEKKSKDLQALLDDSRTKLVFAREQISNFSNFIEKNLSGSWQQMYEDRNELKYFVNSTLKNFFTLYTVSKDDNLTKDILLIVPDVDIQYEVPIFDPFSNKIIIRAIVNSNDGLVLGTAQKDFIFENLVDTKALPAMFAKYVENPNWFSVILNDASSKFLSESEMIEDEETKTPKIDISKISVKAKVINENNQIVEIDPLKELTNKYSIFFLIKTMKLQNFILNQHRCLMID